jgi:hypothetical protein
MPEVNILIGRAIEFGVGEPDDFSAENGPGPFSGIVVEFSDQRLLVKLDMPLKYENREIWGVLASPRHIGGSFENLTVVSGIAVNLIPITDKLALSSFEKAVAFSNQWRTWHLIGGMVLKKTSSK